MKRFDKILCINLARRTDRRVEAIREFDRVGILERVQWVAGVEDAVPIRGFNLAQRNALEVAQGSKNVLILEDDVHFLRGDLNWLWSDLEETDWDMLYLGANLREPLDKVGSHLYRIRNAWTTHAIAYNGEMIDRILEEYPADLLDPQSPGFMPFDEWLRIRIQPKYNCLICSPMAAIQRSGVSDLQGEFTSYYEMEKKGERFMQ